MDDTVFDVKIGFKGGQILEVKATHFKLTKTGNDLTAGEWILTSGNILYLRLDDVSFVYQDGQYGN